MGIRGPKKGIAALILEKTGNGVELVERLIAIARGRYRIPAEGIDGEDGYLPGQIVVCEPKDSLKAIDSLLNRAYGAVPKEVEQIANTKVTRDYSKLTEQENETLARLERKALVEIDDTDPEAGDDEDQAK